jgi:hypothetical protein
MLLYILCLRGQLIFIAGNWIDGPWEWRLASVVCTMPIYSLILLMTGTLVSRSTCFTAFVTSHSSCILYYYYYICIYIYNRDCIFCLLVVLLRCFCRWASKSTLSTWYSACIAVFCLDRWLNVSNIGISAPIPSGHVPN